MADNASRRGATDLGMPLMIVAVAVVGGFLFWLSGQVDRERTEQQAFADSVAAAEAERRGNSGGGGMTLLEAEAIQMDASPYEGQQIRLEDVPVASTLGNQGYWLEMPNGNPFLVSMSAELRDGLAFETDDEVTVEGRIVAINDSVLTAWTEAGTIGEGDRLAAEFATHFLEASLVEPSGGG